MIHARDIEPVIGAKIRARGVDAVIGELARRQHGVDARWQLLDLGLGRRAVGHRVERRRLHRVQRGVYAVGHDSLSPRGRWIAAVLCGGAGSVLSHGSAAALWGLHPSGRPRIDVTVPRERRAGAGITFHRSVLEPDEVTTVDGIPVTTVPRTLLDLGGVLGRRQLERTLNEAEVLRLWDAVSLHELLARHPRRAGTRTLRAVMAAGRAGESVTRSELEERFIELLDAASLPRPRVNAMLQLADRRVEVDCLWRGSGS